jgi:hypothetical protein
VSACVASVVVVVLVLRYFSSASGQAGIPLSPSSAGSVNCNFCFHKVHCLSSFLHSSFSLAFFSQQPTLKSVLL